MEKLTYNADFSVETSQKKYKEYKIARIVLCSNIDDVTTKNTIDESSEQEITCDNRSDFKIALNARYPEFRSCLVSEIKEDPIESGVHYFFEDKFDEYYKDNSYMAAQLLQFFLREYYTDIKKVKAVLHIVSHYTYEQMGQDFVYPVLSLTSHKDKAIKKFALKVFDNWDSVETIKLLKGTDVPREKWPEPEDHASIHDLDADALNDLKTQGNTLSVWYAETEEDLSSAIVAYLASMDKWVELEEVEFIAINSKDVDSVGIKYNKVPNFTYITEYQTKHRDLIELKYDSIENLADIVIKSINEGRDYIIDQGQIRELFTEVVRLGKLHSDDIEKSKHKKLKRLIAEIENKKNTD